MTARETRTSLLASRHSFDLEWLGMSIFRRIASNTIRSGFVCVALATMIAGAAHATDAHAAGSDDRYAYRWPLKTEGDQVAWQFELTPEIYAALRDPELRDFEVINAEGRAVPVAPLTESAQVSPRSQWMWLPSFALPRDAATADDIGLRIERDESGQLRMLEARAQETQTAAATAKNVDYVIDASTVNPNTAARDSRAATIDRIELQWPYGERDTRTRFAVDVSDDLDQWQTLVEGATVVFLRQGASTLQRRTIAMPKTAKRYLRLRHIDGDALQSLQVQARRHDTTTSAYANFVTRTIAAEYAGKEDAGQGAQWYRYRLPAALPATQLGIALTTDNATADLETQAFIGEQWMPMGTHTVFRLRQGDVVVDNDDYNLNVATVAREWRFRSIVALEPAPKLDITYLPDRFVFLAQGKGPYTLVAGSRSAKRAPMPVEQALAPMRKHFGAEWEPPVASLGARATAGGDAAYDAPKTPPNWRGWLLWALLIGGALIIAGFAFSLIRQKPAVGGE
jgi:hypothetical protein